MIGKKGLIGLMKGTAGLVLAAVFAVALVAFFVVPIFATHTHTGAVTPATVDNNQNVTLNFSVTQGSTNAIMNITVNFTAAGWTVPTDNASTVCPYGLNASTALWNASVGAGGILICQNITVGSIGPYLDDGNTTYMAIKQVLAPAGAQASQFNITTTDTAGATYSTLVTVNVLSLSANATLNDTTAAINSQKSYSFTITNNGTDEVSRIFIDYTNWTNATAAANVTCPSIGGAWTKSVTATMIGCYSTGTNLAGGSSTTITVSNWVAINTAGRKNLALTVTGNAGGNYTETLNNPNLTVFGTATTTTIDNSSTPRAISSTLVDVMRINISAAGETVNVSSINLALSGTAQEVDIVGVMIYNETTNLGALIMNPIAGNSTRLGAAGGNVTIFFPAPGWLIPNGSSNLSRVVLNISTAATGGRTFTANITAAANISMTGQTSATAITTGGSFPAFANTTTIIGNLSIVTGDEVVTGNTVALANAANFTTLQFNLTAQGEAVNSITMTINTTATVLGDLSTLMVYNDTGCDGGPVTGSDKLINATAAAPTASQAIRLGNATYNESVGAGVTRCFLVAYNVSVGPAGGNTFQTIVAGNSGVGTGGSSSQSITSYGGSSLQSTAAEIQGNVTVAIADKATSTIVIGTVNYTTLMVNLTANGENLTEIRFIVNTEGTAITSGGVHGLHIARDNNTNGIFDGTGTDTILNTTTSVSGGVTIFLVNATANESIANGSTRSYLIMYNTSSRGGGDVFTTTLAPSNITAKGGVSNNTLTGLGTAANSTLAKIFGNFSIDGFNVTRSAVNTNATNFAILKLNFTATAENMSIEQINITLNATTNGDITAAQLYNDTNNNSVLDASEPVAGAAATISGNVIRFGAPGSNLFNVPNGTVVGVILVVNVSNSAAGFNTIDAHIAAAANVTVKGNQSVVAVTPLGSYAIDPEGFANVRPLSAVANFSTTAVAINSQTTFTIIVNNTAGDFAGDKISEIMINYSGRMNDTIAGNITCPTFLGVTWNKTLDTTNDLIFCNSTGPNNILNPGNTTSPNATVIVSNWVALGTPGNYTIPVIVRGNAGNGTKNASSNPFISMSGSLTMAFADKASSTVQINTTNYKLAMINITPAGEGVYNPVLALNLTSVAGNVTALTIYNNTGCDGSTLGSVLGVNTTSGTLNGTATTVANTTAAAGQNTCFIVAVNVSVGATGGNTITLAMAANNITATGMNSSLTVTATGNDTLASTAAEIYGNVTVTVENLAPSRRAASSDGVAMLKINITALGENLNISAINVTLGNNATGDNLSATNGTRIYNDTNANNAFNFGTDLNFSVANGSFASTANPQLNLTFTDFVVPASTTRTIFVVFNVSSTIQNNAIINATIFRANDIQLIGGVSGIGISPLTGVPATSTNTTLDSSAPTVTITAPTNITTNVRNQSVTFTASNENTDTCVIQNNTANYTLSSCGNITLLAAVGDNTVKIFANDTVNNTAVATIAFTYDNQGPVVTLIAPTNSTVVNSSVELIFTSSDTTGTALQCVRQLDGTNTSIASCANTTMTSLATGAHTVKIFSNDTGNNTNASSTITFTVDQIAPVVTINAPTNITTNTQNQSLNFVAPDNSTVTCVFQNGTVNYSLSSCGNITFMATVGVNALKVFANDTLNNTGVASVTFTYDIQGPVITITSPLNTSYNTTNITLTYTASDTTGTPITCVRQLDGTNTSISSCGNQTFTGSAGSNTVKVFSNDTGNNTNVSSVSFTIDTTAPTVVASGPNGTITAASTILNVTTNENSTCKYDTTDQDYNTMANTMTGAATLHNATVSGLVNATTYTYQVRCQDTAGNAMTTSSVISFSTNITTDITAPNAPGNLTAVQVPGQRTVNLTWSASGSADAVQYRVYRALNSAVTVNSSPVASLGNLTEYSNDVPTDGTWNYTVAAVDAANNRGSGATAAAVTVDTTPPGVTATSPGGTITTNYARLVVNTSETATCKFDTTDKAFVNMSTTFGNTSSTEHTHNVTGLSDNTAYTYFVRCNDTASNNMTTSSQIFFTVNTGTFSEPVSNIDANATYTNSHVLIEVNTSKAAACRFDTTGKAYVNMSTTMNGSSLNHTYNYTGMLDGTKFLYVACQDNFGNNASKTLFFRVDTRSNFGVVRPNIFGEYFTNNSWNSFALPLWELQNSTSLTVFNVTTVLTNLNNSYTRIYHYNGTGWISYTPGDAVNSFVNFTFNGSEQNYYIFLNQTNKRIQLSRP